MSDYRVTWAADIVGEMRPEQIAEVVDSARLCLEHNGSAERPCLTCPLRWEVGHDEYDRCFQHRETDPIAKALVALAEGAK